MTADQPVMPWMPPPGAPPVPWERIEGSLRVAHRSQSPHLISPLKPGTSRRAAVAVVLWGDLAGARNVVMLVVLL